jgi:hypothetical protein
MSTIQIELPDSILSTLSRSPQDLSKDIQFLAAANWYDTGKITLTEAIQITGHTYQGFIRDLKHLKALLSPDSTKSTEKLPNVTNEQNDGEGIMKYAGCWSDMPEADFEEFLQDIYKRRQDPLTWSQEHP